MEAPSSLPRKYAPVFILYLLYIVFRVWPNIAQIFPLTEVFVSTTVVWTHNALLLGLSAAAFLTAAVLFATLVCDAYRWLTAAVGATYRWLTSTPPVDTATPDAMEEGQAPGMFDAQLHSADDEPAAIEATPSPSLSFAQKIAGIIVGAALFSADVYLRHLVRQGLPRYYNINTIASHLGGGIAVLLVGLFVLPSRRVVPGSGEMNNGKGTAKQPGMDEEFVDGKEASDQNVV
ncbi:hypothetical protein DFH09DRAFT_1067629 [Mycena vulgaris]|nr:hypothetical protein DFH09DRAFT_1067629 [Mycena vulgaris]